MNQDNFQKNKPYPFLSAPVRVTTQEWSENVLPLVSIHCKTYMHEPYIRQAIEGFLMQETTFKVEILIHDDASTDKTAKIIKEYESKYPHLIKATCQVENQYKKNPKTEKYIKPYPFTGKYRASCEGDDYWIDPLKLQKQVDILERHPNYVACFTNAKILKEEGFGKDNYRYSQKAKSRVFKPDEVIAKGGGFYPTASMVYRNCVLRDYAMMPKANTSGDVTRAAYLATKGGFYFLSEVTCVYRMHSGGAYSSIISDGQKFLNDKNNRIRFLNEFNVFTKGKYKYAVKDGVAIVQLIVLQFYFKKSALLALKHLKNIGIRGFIRVAFVLLKYRVLK